MNSPFFPLLCSVIRQFQDYVTTEWINTKCGVPVDVFTVQVVNKLRDPLTMRKLLLFQGRHKTTASYKNNPTLVVKRARQLTDLQSIPDVISAVVELLREQGLKKPAVDAYLEVQQKRLYPSYLSLNNMFNTQYADAKYYIKLP